MTRPEVEADDIEEAMIALVPSLRAYARSLARDPTTADDLVQETLLKAWSKLDQFQRGTNLRAWLFTIQRNTFLSLVQKRKREVQDVDGVAAASLVQEPQQNAAMDLEDFKKACATLPLEQREILVLVAAGVSYEEAAEICGCKVGTIKSRLNRARSRLAAMLDGDAGPSRRSGEVARAAA